MLNVAWANAWHYQHQHFILVFHFYTVLLDTGSDTAMVLFIVQTFLSYSHALNSPYRSASENTLSKQANNQLYYYYCCDYYAFNTISEVRKEKGRCVWLFWAYCKWMVKQGDTIKIKIVWQLAFCYHEEFLLFLLSNKLEKFQAKPYSRRC